MDKIVGDFTRNSLGAWHTHSQEDYFQPPHHWEGIQPWSFMTAAFGQMPEDAVVRVTVELCDPLDEIILEDLNLTVRAYNALRRNKITTVRQLVGCTEMDLLDIRNFGVRSLDSVIFGLKDHGLELKKMEEYHASS